VKKRSPEEREKIGSLGLLSCVPWWLFSRGETWPVWGSEGVDPGGEAGDEGVVEEEGLAAADGPVDEAGVEGAAVDA